ncbi:MAG TPA: VCBS repeat-containing protein, partial [Vicinamibacteria bacterium]|nr:VCBS repeat-containing protein [Vicinamibacteria bacterium]
MVSTAKTRRRVSQWLAAGGSSLALAAAAFPADAPRFGFDNVGREAGLTATTVFGGQQTNTYLLETTGCGAALLDYDGDGWLDVFLVNGTTLEGFPKGQEPTSHLYRNRQNGTFEDVTA